MDQSFARGAAAAALTLAAGVAAVAAPLGAQAVGSVQVRPAAPRDSVVVRVINAGAKAQLDSMMVIMRALEDAPASSESYVKLRREADAMFRALSAARFSESSVFFRSGVEMRQVEAPRLKGWIGANIGGAPKEEFLIDSTSYLVHYFRYPLIISVEPDSPAKRAGLAPGDVLVAYDGQDVVRGRVNMTPLFVPERKLEVTVRRDGEEREFSVLVAKTPERIAVRRLMPAMAPPPPMGEGRMPATVRGGVGVGEMSRRPGAGDGPIRVEVATGGVHSSGNRIVFFGERNGIFGAGLMTVNAELAKVTGLEQGVLVQECAEETPAFKAGLRTGDVIVLVAGQQALTANEVQTRVSSLVGAERSVEVQVVRDKKPVAVTLRFPR